MNFLPAKIIILLLLIISACSSPEKDKKELWAEDILGNPAYRAISYGGYRGLSRDQQPSMDDLKDDLKILQAIGIRILRTYNSQQYPQASNLVKAISELKSEDPQFEMYVMLGAWIDCKGAWGPNPDHRFEDPVNNQKEVDATVELAKKYPDIVKVIAVGNEAMVHWASSYYVYPEVILKYVNQLQDLKQKGELSEKLWITSSDNFASWGGDDDSYHIPALTELIKAVDYISMHTYPFHDTHYHPVFWDLPRNPDKVSDLNFIQQEMQKAVGYAKGQYEKVKAYVASLGIDKEIHIGETGWSTASNSHYGANGSLAADEFKLKLYHNGMRAWTDSMNLSCFYFEAFDEQWKDSLNQMGSENHFGLINLQAEAKYPLWDLVEAGVFKDLERDGQKIRKSYGGDEQKLIADILKPVDSE